VTYSQNSEKDVYLSLHRLLIQAAEQGFSIDNIIIGPGGPYYPEYG
jgi:hypothetical protein